MSARRPIARARDCGSNRSQAAAARFNRENVCAAACWGALSTSNPWCNSITG
jgi:hypothetical protein